MGAQQTILSLFMPDKTREQFQLFVARLQSPEFKEKLIRLAYEYEGYYAQVKTQELQQLESKIVENDKLIQAKKMENDRLLFEIENSVGSIVAAQNEIQYSRDLIDSYKRTLIQIITIKIDLLQSGVDNQHYIANLEEKEKETKQLMLERGQKMESLTAWCEQKELFIERVKKDIQTIGYDMDCANVCLQSNINAKNKIERKLKRGDFFLTPLQKRIECFCHIAATVPQAQSGHLLFSFMSQDGQNSSKAKETRNIFREFFQYYAECVSVLLPNYVEAETAVCMALWSSEPEKVIEKLTQCMALVDERKKSIVVIAKDYSRYSGNPGEETGHYLIRELTEKLARMEMLQRTAKASINAAVSELEVPQLAATDPQVFFAA